MNMRLQKHQFSLTFALFIRGFMKKLLLLFAIVISVLGVQAQSFHTEIKNIVQPNNTTIEFDIYIYNTGTDVMYLAGYQAGINFNYAGLANGGTITGSFVAGSSWNPATSSQLTAPMNNPNWNINATSNQIRLIAAIIISKSSCPILPTTGPGIKMGTFRMTNTVPFSSCTKPNFIWGFVTGTGLTKSTAIGYINAATSTTSWATQTSFSYNNQGPQYYVESNPNINPISSPPTNLNAQACYAYYWNGNTVTTSGTYYDTLVNSMGCDSILALNLVITGNGSSLAQTSGSQSVAGNVSFSLNQTDGSTLNYSNSSCQLIAKVSDAPGGNNLGATTAEVTVDGSVQSYLGQPYVARHFNITPTNNGPANVTLYLTQDDFNDYNLANGSWPDLPLSGNNSDPNIGQIRITKVQGALGSGPASVITPTVLWNGNYWELSFPVTSFSQFFIHAANTNNGPLPIRLAEFTGRMESTEDILEWTTSMEAHNDYFVLEHSIDGQSFSFLSKVSSKAVEGNSSTPITYSTINPFPSSGRNYYRLQQVDVNGSKNVVSEVLLLNRTSNAIIASLAPNPCIDKTTLSLDASRNAQYTLLLYNTLGQEVYRSQIEGKAGHQTVDVNLHGFSGGVYVISLRDMRNQELFTQRLIKQ